LIFNVYLRVDEGREKTISREDRNIRKNLVKFANNLPFSYFKVRRKQLRFDLKIKKKREKSETE